MGEELRLFFALETPEEIKGEMEKFCCSLDRSWRPVKTEQMHVTLAFMGSVSADELSRIIATGERIADNTCSFRLQLAETGVFPESSNPRVLYARADGGEVLMALVNALRNELGDLADQKKFKPHLTLARCRVEGPRKVLRRFRGGWDVNEFVLYKSTLGDNGAKHELIQRFRLCENVAELEDGSE